MILASSGTAASLAASGQESAGRALMSFCLKSFSCAGSVQKSEGRGATIEARSPGSCSHIFEQQDWHSPNGSFLGNSTGSLTLFPCIFQANIRVSRVSCSKTSCGSKIWGGC